MPIRETLKQLTGREALVLRLVVEGLQKKKNPRREAQKPPRHEPTPPLFLKTKTRTQPTPPLPPPPTLIKKYGRPAAGGAPPPRPVEASGPVPR